MAADGSPVPAKARDAATITVSADDGNGGTLEDSLMVMVKAAPVVASALADVSLEEGEHRTYPCLASSATPTATP